jgi:hypothetical protein
MGSNMGKDIDFAQQIIYFHFLKNIFLKNIWGKHVIYEMDVLKTDLRFERPHTRYPEQT